MRVSLAPVPGDPQACEVTMAVDLRRGLGANLFGYGAVASGVGGLGGAAGLLTAKKALALAGAALVGPAVAGYLVAGVAAVAASGSLYRWEIRKAEAELAEALTAIEASMRAFDLFGAAPPPPRVGAPPQYPPYLSR